MCRTGDIAKEVPMSHHAIPASLAAAFAVAATLAACAPQSPEDRVTALRAEYEAELNSFQVVEQPALPAPATAPVDEAVDGPPGAEPVVGEDALPSVDPDAAEPEPAAAAADVRQDVLLDIVIHNRSDERLPGLTLDVEQVDAQREPKTSYRIYVDTSNIAPGSRAAVAHRLEDVDYALDDAFRVEVRQAIPPEQREEYRELSEAGEQP
jgi:hypothetical protein